MATPPVLLRGKPGHSCVLLTHKRETGTRDKEGFVCDCSLCRAGRKQTKRQRQNRQQGETFAIVKLQGGTALEGRVKPQRWGTRPEGPVDTRKPFLFPRVIETGNTELFTLFQAPSQDL